MRLGLCGTAVALAGCGTPQYEFSKPGMTPAQVNADHEACWNYALNTPEGQSGAKMVNDASAVGTVLGGVGSLAALAVEKSNEDDPKKNAGNQAARSDCMAAKGYAQKMAGW